MSYTGWLFDRQRRRWYVVCQGTFAECWAEVLARSDGERHGRAVLRSDDNPQGERP